jgi:predicted nucleic acid-binding protein
MIVIDHLNSIAAASHFLISHDHECVLSVITRAEVLTGYGPDETDEIKILLDKYPILEINPTIADHAAQLRRQFNWKLPDAFQAALAQVHSLSLVTRNIKDFPPAKHPFVIVPYRF